MSRYDDDLDEATISTAVAGSAKPVGDVIKRTAETKKCSCCEALEKSGAKVKCGMCGRNH